MNSFPREPVAEFVLAKDALAATLDQFQALIDEAPHPDTGKRGAGLPIYGVGCGFIQHRSGERLDRRDADRRLAEHRAAATGGQVSANLARFAERCAAELSHAIALSFGAKEIDQ